MGGGALAAAVALGLSAPPAQAGYEAERHHRPRGGLGNFADDECEVLVGSAGLGFLGYRKTRSDNAFTSL